MRIYIATSYANTLIDGVIDALREVSGYEVYDFRKAGPGPATVFDPSRTRWTLTDYTRRLASPVARQKFADDVAAIDCADVLILLEPSGNDAHSEAGYAHGRNAPVIVYLGKGFRPGLMHRFCNGYVASIPELLFALSQVVPRDAAATGDVTAVALSPFSSSRRA
jgi:hypothetical protein